MKKKYPNDTTVRNLHLKRLRMKDAGLANHHRYLSIDSGVFLEKYTEKRNCPACSVNDGRILFRESGGTYVACNSCSMVYLNPALKDEVLEDYYRNNHQVQSEIVSSDLEFYSKLYLQGLNSIVKSFPDLGCILDVGCSSGTFLDIAKNAGWKTFGLELNKKELAVGRAKGHFINEEMINTANFDEKFCAITLWDVFEHIKDGIQFLND